MPPKYRQFAKYLSARRAERQLTQQRLADMVGVTKPTIHYWESGKVLPQPTILEALARALKVSYEDLFVLAGPPPDSLPSPKPYLRTLFPNASERTRAEAERIFAKLEADEKRGKRRRR